MLGAHQSLYRTRGASVCSGLAHYFDIDTVRVQIGFVVVALIGGGGVLAYALLWAILDPVPLSDECLADER